LSELDPSRSARFRFPKPEELPRNRWDPSTPAEEPSRAYAQLLVDGEPMSFLIEERFREIPREPSARELAREKREYRYHAPRTESLPTGALRIVRIDSTCRWFPRRKTWFDQGKQRVESKIPQILATFRDRALEIKTKRDEEERERRERLEQERLRKETAERRQAHANLIAELERQAGAWFRARLLQRYLRALRRAAGEGRLQCTLGEEKVDFLLWAERYAAQLDPLSTTPLNPDQQRDRGNSGEQVLKDLLIRFLGCDGQPSWKVAPETSAGDVDSEAFEKHLRIFDTGDDPHRLGLLAARCPARATSSLNRGSECSDWSSESVSSNC